MLQIETRGSWWEMGSRLGATFRDWFPRVFERFAEWLGREFETYRPGIAALRELIEHHAPELMEETEGLADALALDPDLVLGYRYFNDLRRFMAVGCSGFFLAGTDAGPLLVRTCDIEPDLSQDVQVAHLRRPAEGPATIALTYLSLTGGTGINEHGLGLVGSSATAKGMLHRRGLPGALLCHLILTRCRTVAEACAMAGEHEVRGGGSVLLVADATGASALLELAPGRPIRVHRRPADRDWQACSNFCFSADLENLAGPAYLGNAYARYGRMAHQLGEGFLPRTLLGAKRLVLDIAQPGLVCHEPQCFFRTAYAFVAELAGRRLHLVPGHPAENPYRTLVL